MYCEKCGKEIQEEWSICPYCGGEISTNATQDIVIEKEVDDSAVKENDFNGELKNDGIKNVLQNEPANKENTEKIKSRSFWKYVLFSIFTFGIYSIYAFYMINRDINKICEEDGKKIPNYFLVILLSIITFGIYGLYWWYIQEERIRKVSCKHNIVIKESGLVMIVLVLCGCVFIPSMGVLLATYILFDNVNHIKKSYNGEILVEEKRIPHPHLVRNFLIIWIACFIVAFIFLMFLSSFDGPIPEENKIKTEKVIEDKNDKVKKKEEKSLKDIDVSSYRNKPIDELIKTIPDLSNDGNLYYNSAKTFIVTLDKENRIDSINIKGNPKKAPYFSHVHLEDKVENVDKNLENDYRRIKTESTVIDAQGNTLREYREKDTTNKLSIIYEGKSKKVTEINWLFNGIDFIFPDSSEKLIESKEIENLTDVEKQIAINEIFARHGRRFDNVDIQKYFDSKEWYNGSTAPADFDEKVFNAVEKDNILRLSGKSDTEQEKQNTVEEEEVINGYIHINATIPTILKNPEQYIGKKVCFDGVLQKNFNGILELSYFEGGGEIQVSAYYDKNKLRVMPEEPVHDASTIVWGTVSGANEQTGVEIQLESIYIGANDIYFPQNATQYYQVPSFRELNYSDNFDLGEKIILEGILQYDDNNIDYKLTMEDGRCLLSSSMKAFADMSIYEVTSLDSFLDKRVRVYGFYGGVAPLVAVEYIEPLE